VPDADGCYWLRRTPTIENVRAFHAVGPIDKLSIAKTRPITKTRPLTAERAQPLRALPSVRWLWLWCETTRAAIKHVVAIPGLEILDVLNIKGSGKLSGFASAPRLHTFRANCSLHERDVLEIAECYSLRELGIQRADLTDRALDALLALPNLESLDIEGTVFDDRMAERLSASESLQWLEIGATRLTRRGLEHLCTMPRLRGLDLWATPLAAEDYELLNRLPALEYVSIGSYDETPLDGERLVPLLLSLPALKRVWLDGVTLDRAKVAALEGHVESVRVC
jgi:hypothetical protein